MVRKFIVLCVVAIGLSAVTVSATAQPRARAPGVVLQEANALRAQIHRYHAGPGIWTGSTPPPPGYCRVLSTGELVVKELVYLANRAVQYGPPGMVLPLAARRRRARGRTRPRGRDQQPGRVQLRSQRLSVPGAEFAVRETRSCPLRGEPANARLSPEGRCAAARGRRAAQPHAAVPARHPLTTAGRPRRRMFSVQENSQCRCARHADAGRAHR